MACFSLGFVPIPASTSTALFTSQKVLFNKIGALYSYTDVARYLDEVGGLNDTVVATYMGTTVLDFVNMLVNDVFPGSGLISGFLARSAAATFISVLGLTLKSVLDEIEYQGLRDRSQKDMKKFIGYIFRSEFKKYSENIQIASVNDVNILDKYIAKRPSN